MLDVDLTAVRVLLKGKETPATTVEATKPTRTAAQLLTTGGVAAYRGASGHWPENTLAGYRSSTWWGVDAIEIDIAATSDGKIVCHHGTDTMPTVGRAGSVDTMTWTQLSKWSISAKDTDRPFQPRGKITTLTEVITAITDRILIITPQTTTVVDPALTTLADVRDRVVWRAPAGHMSLAKASAAGFTTAVIDGEGGAALSTTSKRPDEELFPAVDGAHRAGRGVIMGPLATDKDVLRARVMGADVLSMSRLRGTVDHRAAQPTIDARWWRGFKLGTTMPTAENTGLVAPLTQRRPGERIYADTPGEVFRDMEIGEIVVRAPGVRIHNCLFTGVAGITTSRGMVDATNANCSDLKVTFCEFDNSRVEASWWYTAIMGHDFEVIRCHMHHVNDGVGIFNSRNPLAWTNTAVLGCYIHDLAYWHPSPTHSDNRTHNECIQHQGGGRDLIVGNRLIANPSAKVGNGTDPTANPYAVIGSHGSVTGQTIGITPNVRPAEQITIVGNWLTAGAQSLTVVENRFPFENPVGYIARNRFGGANPPLTRDGQRLPRAVLILQSIPTVGLPLTTGPDTTHANTNFDGSPVTIYRTTQA